MKDKDENQVNANHLFSICKKIIANESAESITAYIEEYEQDIDLNFYTEKTKLWLPLHYASKLGNKEIIFALIDKGANPNLGVKAMNQQGYVMGWKTGFTLIEDLVLREEIREYYNKNIKKVAEHKKKEAEHNKLVASSANATNPLLNLGDPLKIISANFINDEKSFLSFYLTCQKTYGLFTEQKKWLDKIVSGRAEIDRNLSQIWSFNNYPPKDDMTIETFEAEANQVLQYSKITAKNVKRNQDLTIEIEEAENNFKNC